MSKWGEMGKVLEIMKDEGLEVNLNDNTTHYGTVWIGWACPQLDCEDYIWKGDIEGDVADAVLQTYDKAIHALVVKKRKASRPTEQSDV